MNLSPGAARASWIGALAMAAAGSALWVEHRSREADRRHHPRHHLVYIHGTRLHYRLVGEGPPVLLVHGNLVDGEDFEASGLVERLARQYQVLVIDRPGFGHSDRPRGTTWTPARQARLLHDATQTLGVHRPVVVGHSIGTQVAMAMALRHPDSVAGLVLVGGYYWPGMRLDAVMAAPMAVPGLGDVLRYTSAAWTARAALEPTVRALFDPAPVPERFFECMPRELLLRPLQQRACAEDGTHLVPQARALRAHYEELKVPATLIAGSEDKVVSPAQTQRLHELLAPRTRLRLLAGVGHMAHYHAQEQIAQAVAEALGAPARGFGNVPAPERRPGGSAGGSTLPAYSPASTSAD